MCILLSGGSQSNNKSIIRICFLANKVGKEMTPLCFPGWGRGVCSIITHIITRHCPVNNLIPTLAANLANQLITILDLVSQVFFKESKQNRSGGFLRWSGRCRKRESLVGFSDEASHSLVEDLVLVLSLVLMWCGP